MFDSIINKTPLSYRTNWKIGGVAPRVSSAPQDGGQSSPQIAPRPARCLSRLASHRTGVVARRRLRGVHGDRQQRLLRLIETATGKSAYVDTTEEVDRPEAYEDTVEAALIVSGEQVDS